MNRLSPLGALFLAALAASCVSGPVTVPDDMPPAKIVQKAQEASDVNKYKAALQYYGILKERYGGTGEYLATAEYEIAFIRYKQKKYADARRGLENLLARYKQDAGALPPQFRVLSEVVLARIAERGY
ncbi:MAG: tetratricopeptide repeat protein [Treponema sp.]|jgi:outer membrane protein assembly factor BamD (BamD/ComL family)|nr:tetratricopeptide repeat protein [Treponema sp.]